MVRVNVDPLAQPTGSSSLSLLEPHAPINDDESLFDIEAVMTIAQEKILTLDKDRAVPFAQICERYSFTPK